MKFISAALLLVVLCVASVARAEHPRVVKGVSYKEVIQILGEPTGMMGSAVRKILLFDVGSVTLQGGKVIEVDITAESIVRAEELQAEREYEAAQREKGLVPYEGKWITQDELRRKTKIEERLKKARQQHAYPEDNLIKISCSYKKTEPAWCLPDGIVPRPGRYTYEVYIPRGYHDLTGRQYPCIMVAAGSGADAVLRRAREEKWIAVIFPAPRPETNLEGTLGAFLAAYDDVEQRFRISPVHRFVLQTTTDAGEAVTLYAALRNLSGIVVHETSFWDMGDKDYFYGCLKMNPKLRICGIFGSMKYREFSRRAHRMRIEEKAPRHKIEQYKGRKFLAPVQSVNNAIDWLKKESRIP